MLSSNYFRYRWSWYKPILNRGEDPITRCVVDSRRLPLRFVGEDGAICVPYAVDSRLEQTLLGSIRRLYEYAVRYIVKGTKVSAHQLPNLDAESRPMMQHLRKEYPHLSQNLLHHWCADEQGGKALQKLLNGMWEQSWNQDQADVAPWVAAVNTLLLKLLRSSMSRLPKEHSEQTDHVLLCVVGGLFLWALQDFLKKHVEGAVEVTRISTYEAMIIPATPLTFFRDQPEDSLLGDARHVILAYGLEPDLVPRMRHLRAKLGPKNEPGMLKLLGKDRLGNHLLKRSWARLSLWEMAELSGSGGWMQWVLDVKRLDQLLASPEKYSESLAKPLQPLRDHLFAKWLLAQFKGGRSAAKMTPWQQDDSTLNAFRVFDEDVKVEIARRQSERVWVDQRPELTGKGKSTEADRVLENAYKEGKIVLLQTDFSKSLHGGKVMAAKQACLRVDWSDYLSGMSSLYSSNMQDFLSQTFMPGVFHQVEGRESVYLDDCSASGCLIRGPVATLVDLGIHMRRQMWEWYQDMVDKGQEGNIPAVPMCIALIGDWQFSKYKHANLGEYAFVFSLALAQASSGISRDCGMGRLIAYKDNKEGLRPFGGVRVETLDTGVGQRVQVLYNNGLAITAAALAELTGELRAKAEIHEYRVDKNEAKSVLSGFRMPAGELDLVAIQLRSSHDEPPILIARVGQPCLAGVDVDLFEVLDPVSDEAALIVNKGLPLWASHRG